MSAMNNTEISKDHNKTTHRAWASALLVLALAWLCLADSRIDAPVANFWVWSAAPAPHSIWRIANVKGTYGALAQEVDMMVDASCRGLASIPSLQGSL